MTLPPKIFDHKILLKNRNRSIANFNKSNFIHKFISDIIFDIILDQKHNFKKILEIGAMDNYLSKIIKDNFIESDIFSSEISPKWSKLNNDYSKIIMNDEFISFKKNSFDLICSNLNAHFYNDLLGFLIQSHYCLKNNGLFIASFIGNDSFKLLKDIFQKIELEKYQRFTSRFIPTTDIKTAGMLMQKAGFKDIISLSEEINIDYNDPKKILTDIKQSGGSNIMFNRSKKFMTSDFINNIYNHLNKSKINDKININLNIIIILGYKN
ncbi:methyltransferase domain-containing protein [Rickettsiales bacterium]|nr:methyltransferase domain-containing protein [Rickettsiales bacterium]